MSDVRDYQAWEDLPPVMAFGHDMDWAVIGPVLQRAREALAIWGRR